MLLLLIVIFLLSAGKADPNPQIQFAELFTKEVVEIVSFLGLVLK
jgi:hypothetical protein